MSVALKSLQLTVKPGDSPQDWGIPPAGLGAWQVRKMQIKTRPIFLTKQDWPIGQKENCFLCNQGSPGNPKWLMGPFCLLDSQLETHDSL